MRDPRTVAATYARSLVSSVEVLGIPADRLLLGLPLTTVDLEDAQGRLGVELVRRLWQRAVELSGDGLLGLHLAEHMRPSTFRILGHAAMSCATLGQALELMLRYQRLVSEAGTLSAQVQTNGDTTLLYTEQPLHLALLPQQVEAILAGILAQARWLATRPPQPLAVTFRHPPQGDLQRYHDSFGITPCFCAQDNSLLLSATDLRSPLPQADADLCRLHCEMADRQLEQLPPIGFVTGFALHWLAGRASGSARINDLASALGMSVRSLQRQLQIEGQSWAEVVDSARRDTLLQLLHGGVTLDEAAQQLGYHDASSLSRAIRRWFGTTSKQLRQRLLTEKMALK